MTTTVNGTSTYKVSRHEANLWAQQQFATASVLPETQGYYPRYPWRRTGPGGELSEEGVRTVSVIAAYPSALALRTQAQLRNALGELVADSRIRIMPPHLLHLTYCDMAQGRTAAEDAAQIERARPMRDVFERTVAQMTPQMLTLTGFTVGPRQIMATYQGDEGWHGSVEQVAAVESAVPIMSNRYDLTRSPLVPGSKALQTTVAVFESGIATAPLLERMASFLPGPDSAFRPMRWNVQDLRMVEWRHSARYVCTVADVLAQQQFRSASGAPRPAWRPGVPPCVQTARSPGSPPVGRRAGGVAGGPTR